MWYWYNTHPSTQTAYRLFLIKQLPLVGDVQQLIVNAIKQLSWVLYPYATMEYDYQDFIDNKYHPCHHYFYGTLHAPHFDKMETQLVYPCCQDSTYSYYNKGYKLKRVLKTK